MLVRINHFLVVVVEVVVEVEEVVVDHVEMVSSNEENNVISVEVLHGVSIVRLT